jgi:hypothetical protein
MSPVAHLISEQLQEIVEDENTTDQGARQVQKQVDGEEDLNPDNTSSVLSTVVDTINTEFEHDSLDAADKHLNAHLIHQSIDDHVLGH